jgi:hypothetical protein
MNPRQEIYVTWMELADRFGEGYYLVEIPKETRQRYAVPAEQRAKTPRFTSRTESNDDRQS